jgi:tRNA(Ile2) C34 agmatinyltransferase TiaS
MPYCTECGGKLNWDRKLRQYSCESCGMTFTEAQLSEALDRLHTPMEDEVERRSRRNRDYLDWWLSDKKGRR